VSEDREGLVAARDRVSRPPSMATADIIRATRAMLPNPEHGIYADRHELYSNRSQQMDTSTP